ncbi:MAG: ABC transporter substrate-binding protein [Christensenellales bacterium]
MKKILCALLCVLLLAAPFCTAEELPTVRVGILASYYSAAIYYADQMGYDTEEGIDMQPQEFASGAPMNECFAAGELEAADMGPAAVHAVGKFGAKCIAQNAKQVAVNLLVRGDSPLLEVVDENGVYGNADLVRGMTIMGPAGTYAHYLVIGYLDYIGLTIDDVNFVGMEYPQAMQAFELGEGDICCMQNPNVYDAVSAGYKTIGDPAIVAPMFENLVCFGAIYESNPQAIEKFLKVVYRAQEDFLNDDALAAKWLAEYYAKMGYSASEEALMDEIQNQKPLLTLEEAASVKVGETLIATAHFMQSQGMIEQAQTDTVIQNIASDLLQNVCAEKGVAWNQ